MTNKEKENMLSPPYPPPGDPRLEITLHEARHMMATEPVPAIILWAVVHGWMEGYIAAAGEQFRPSSPLSDTEAYAWLQQIEANGLSDT